MAKIFNAFNDSRGVDYTGAYARLSRFSVDLPQKEASFEFFVYRDQTAYLEGKEKVADKLFEVNNLTGSFDYYYGLHLTSGLNIAVISYMIATNQKYQIGSYPDPENGILLPIYTGYFDNAVDAL